jgi:hypothetical protein
VIVALLMILMLMQAEGKGRWWLLASFALILLQIMISNAAPYSDDGVGYIGGMKASLLAGAVLIAYLAVGLVLLRDGLVYALFSAVLITLLLSWGRNLMPLTDFFLEYVPGYNKFRAVTIILVVLELAAPVLGILYLDRLIKEGGWNKLVESRSLIGMGAVLGVLFVMAAMPDSILSFVSDQEREMLTQQAEDPQSEAMVMSFVEELKSVRIGMFRADVMRSFAFVLGAGVLVFLFGRKKIGKAVLLGGIGALILLDQWTVDKRYMNNERERGRYVHWVDDALQQNPYTANAADKAILEAEWTPAAQADHEVNMARLKEERQKEDGLNKIIKPEEEITARFASLRRHGGYRVLGLNNPFNDTRISYFHKSIGGYHGAKLERYQELIDFYIAPELQAVIGAFGPGATMQTFDSVLAHQPVLNMLNTKYIIYADDKAPILNTNALGSAWFVDEVKEVKDANEEITMLGTIDPAKTAVVDARYYKEVANAAKPDPTASVKLNGYRSNDLSYTVRSANGGVVVFSEIWYGPDWVAEIDGKPAPYVRADYVLRAMQVPAGEHTVRFHIVSKPYEVGGRIASISSFLLLLLVLLALGWDWRKRGEEVE